MEDYLKLWKERNMGWALWNLRGGCGVLDSGRSDVEYEDFRGYKLDRKMLELLQRY
jgi:endoglucanase